MYLGKYILCSIGLVFLANCKGHASKPRIIISTDIGGTDPDDFQSFIHLLMYTDVVNLEGLISSPFGNGRKEDFAPIIDLYEKELPKLVKKSISFPSAESLRQICKQGALEAAPFRGYTKATEGSDWIIKKSKEENEGPLWILVWGGLEDLAQALHDAPEIKNKIKVYWIGGPNKKWSVNAYSYIAEFHPDLWIIEANATYRGWFMDENGTEEDLKSQNFYTNHIKGKGSMAQDFANYYEGVIKMGDTPSFAYVLNGDPDNPESESWGGRFESIKRSSRIVFKNQSTFKDTICAYGIVEWHFKGPSLAIAQDSSCFTLKIQNQDWPGYYLGNGTYAVKYSSKKPENGTYSTSSSIPELDNLMGSYVSTIPWPGKENATDYQLGNHWYSDIKDPAYFIEDQQGARTVSIHKQHFMKDWAERWNWLR